MMTDTKKKELTIIVPCYNGSVIVAKQLPLLISYLKTKDFDYNIIVVDDGSSDRDNTRRACDDNSVEFIGLDHNIGKGGAVRAGMMAATGDYIIFTDVDIPFEYEAIDRFYLYLDFKEFDVVVGDRTLPGSNYFTQISWMRNLGSNIFSFIVGRFVSGGFFDTQCGMKGFRKAAAKDIFSKARVNGFAFDVELLYISLKRNYDIKRLPVVLRCQEGSSVNLLVHGTRMLFDLLYIKWNHMLGRYNAN